MSEKKTLLLSHRNKAHDLWGHEVSLNIYQGGCWGKEQPFFNIIHGTECVTDQISFHCFTENGHIFDN